MLTLLSQYYALWILFTWFSLIQYCRFIAEILPIRYKTSNCDNTSCVMFISFLYQISLIWYIDFNVIKNFDTAERVQIPREQWPMYRLKQEGWKSIFGQMLKKNIKQIKLFLFLCILLYNWITIAISTGIAVVWLTSYPWTF